MHALHTAAGSTPETVAQLIAWEQTPIPIEGKIPTRKGWETRRFQPGDWLPGESIGLRMGLQEQTGFYEHCLDLDSHAAHQDAQRALRRIERRLPAALRQRLFTARSTGGAGRYIIFLCRTPIPNGLLLDGRGRRAGEFLGAGRHVVLPTPDRWLQGKLSALPILDDQDLDQLLRASGYRPSHTSKSGHTEPIEISDKQIAYHTRHIGPLIERMKKALQPTTQTRQTIEGRYSCGDPSQDRYNCIFGLMKFAGFDDAEIAALALHFCAWNRSGRALYADVLRCIAKADKRIPDRKIYTGRYGSRNHAPAQPIERTEPRAPGRPASYTAETYLHALYALIDAGELVLLNRKERAQALGCSVATVDRVERVLLNEGKIERCTSSDRRRSWVRILPNFDAIKIIESGDQNRADSVLSAEQEQPRICSTAMPQTARVECTHIEGTRLLDTTPAPAAPASAGMANPPCSFPTDQDSGAGGRARAVTNLIDDPTLGSEPAPELKPKQARRTLPKNPTIDDIPTYEAARARALNYVIWLKGIGSLSEARAVTRRIREHDKKLARLYTERDQIMPRLLDYAPSESPRSHDRMQQTDRAADRRAGAARPAPTPSTEPMPAPAQLSILSSEPIPAALDHPLDQKEGGRASGATAPAPGADRHHIQAGDYRRLVQAVCLALDPADPRWVMIDRLDEPTLRALYAELHQGGL